MIKKNTAKNLNKKEKSKRSLSQEFNVWIDKQDVMLEFHVSERTLFNWRKKKVIPFTRLGRKIIYNRSLLEQILKNGMDR